MRIEPREHVAPERLARRADIVNSGSAYRGIHHCAVGKTHGEESGRHVSLFEAESVAFVAVAGEIAE